MKKDFISNAASLLFKFSGEKRLTVLIFHRVLEARDPMRPGEPTVVEFSRQMEILRNYFNPLSLSDALSHLDRNTLPERAVCVTFDDGYSDNETLALPVLEKYDIPACIFVATKYLNGGVMWNDRVIEGIRTYTASELDLSAYGLSLYPMRDYEQRRISASSIISKIKHVDPNLREEVATHIGNLGGAHLPKLMLSTDQLRRLSLAGVEIGGHTHSHPILASLSSESSKQEIALGKRKLEEQIGSPIRYFAYPNGCPGIDYLSEHTSYVEELGFEAALSTHWGVSGLNTDRYQIPRFTPWDKSRLGYIFRLALNHRNVC